MAFTASIPFTDAEQAVIAEAAAIAAPNATAAQIKTWIQKVGKEAVREKVLEIVRQGALEAENVARRTKEAEHATKWPDPTEIATPVVPAP